MSQAASQPDAPMTVAEFLAWHDAQPEGEQYELLDGRPVLMAPERLSHARAKTRAGIALEAASRHLGCRAYVDGPMVAVTSHRAHQPDALLRCGPPLPPDDKMIPDPLVVVEVLSPSSARLDLVKKMEGYFAVESVRHYLVVILDTRRVLHFAREAAGEAIRSVFLAEGETLRLDPPGVSLAVADFLPEPDAPQ